MKEQITIIVPISVSQLIEHFQKKILESEFKDIVKIKSTGLESFDVTIKKMGTSTLSFDAEACTMIESLIKLKSMDVSFFHKNHIPAVVEWIRNQVELLGGSLESE
jgi:hypothetical protein